MDITTLTVAQATAHDRAVEKGWSSATLADDLAKIRGEGVTFTHEGMPNGLPFQPLRSFISTHGIKTRVEQSAEWWRLVRVP